MPTPSADSVTEQISRPHDSSAGARADRGARPRAGLAFAVLAVVQATLIFTITLISIPLPDIAHELGLGPSDLVLVQAAYGLPYSGLLLFGGRLADRYGGRRLLAAGLALFGLASAAAAFAPTFEALVALRFTQGIGAALTAPAAMAVLRVLFPAPAAYGRAMATWGGVSVLGSAVGTLTSGVVTWVSWRWMFAVPVLVSVLALAVARRLLPAGTADASRARPGLDPAGAVLATLGISLGSYGLIVSEDHPWTSPTVLVPLAAGAVLLAAFLVVERRVRHPLLPPGFTRIPHRIVGLTGVLLAAAGIAVVNLLLSLYLQRMQDWSPLATAGAFLPFTLVLIVTNRAAAPLVGRFGAGRVTAVGLAAGAAGLALLAGIGPDTSYALGLLPGLILLPAGTSLVFSGSAVLTTTHVPAHQAGLAGGVMNTAMELGPTVGLAALMAVAATKSDVLAGYGWAFGTAGAVYLAAALTAAAMVRRAPAGAGNPPQN
ncbi:putative drug efflux pump [Streptomyces sp. NBRC 110611]|uniref:MFS transporter n=1 Tax=Streptomyces sp. NBRC 110611 TaxID=1621259 RepID=UPI000858C716|nr:MFS transporter [Streptomyces sp. NBRC 110611]GAU65850.1 putative drug efflux pump [Streptomyces sp. NBRC 110611]